MPNQAYNFIWRCIKCSNHFANITKVDGVLRQEKKCPKCKSLNIITLGSREIVLQCKLFENDSGGYGREVGGSYPYPDLE